MPEAWLSMVGTVLEGMYRIVGLVGQGGMGKVYEAMHLRLHKRVAVKVMVPAPLAGVEPDARERVKHDWDGAKAYCSSLTLADGGWRLPTKDELLSIVGSDAFPSTASGWFWSSSPYAGSSSFACYVGYHSGTVSRNRSETNYVRCVR